MPKAGVCIFLKRFSVLSLAFLFGLIANFTFIPPAEAACGTYYEDNDDPNQLTIRSGFTTLTKHSASYRGDYRLSKNTSGNGSYFWTSPGGTCKASHSYYAYLNNQNFTNTKAAYQFTGTNDAMLTKYVDQYNAPGGWNYVGFGYQSSTPRIWLSDKGVTGVKTGADGIKFVSN